jgi:hypothetical protein
MCTNRQRLLARPHRGGYAGPSSTQAIMMQADPGGPQIPQLALQQYVPLAHTTLPQISPSTGGGSQDSATQAPPIGAQMPQLGLQQYSPEAQVTVPHLSGSGSGSGAGQRSVVQA